MSYKKPKERVSLEEYNWVRGRQVWWRLNKWYPSLFYEWFGTFRIVHQKSIAENFPAIKNPPCNAGNVASMPIMGTGTHVRQGIWAHAPPQLLSLCSGALKMKLLKPACPRASAQQQEKTQEQEAHALPLERSLQKTPHAATKSQGSKKTHTHIIQRKQKCNKKPIAGLTFSLSSPQMEEGRVLCSAHQWTQESELSFKGPCW